MNRKIGMASAVVNIFAVAGFAFSMLVGTDYGSYIFSMFIAFSFVPMIGAFCYYSRAEKKVAGYTAMLFAAIYAVLILLVYFAQVTVVSLGGLNEQALRILDYSKYGLFFSYDLLGYGMMALSTFFAGLTVAAETKADKWLKALLMIHGIFFISCFLLPMFGLFSTEMEGASWIGIAILEFWCAYFIPVGILCFKYFKKQS